MAREVKECPICGGELTVSETTIYRKVVLTEDCEDIVSHQPIKNVKVTRVMCLEHENHDQDAMAERQQLCTRAELVVQRDLATARTAKDMVIHINAVLMGQIEPEEWLIDACQSSRAGTDTILPIQGE